ncbi:MAG TPA: DUF1285 domain-containing protein [Candidatus Binataceae bacterium]|nr:DUF1285 domain-containing protein [Candidatus Binataceae bacterium]
MAVAGFYTVESGRISFRKDGFWYSDDERIENERIAMLFSKSIQRRPDGGYFLEVGDERADITVEDTPYVVKSIESRHDGSLNLILNDDSRESLDPAQLEVAPDHVLYTRVKDGRFRARFIRSAYNHLAPMFEADDAGAFFIRIGATRYRLKTAGAFSSTDNH